MKVDGELWFLVKRQGEVALCAYNGRVLQGIPLTDEAQRLMEPMGESIIAGELLGLPAEGRPRVMHVAHALADVEVGHEQLQFKAFDLVEDGGLDSLRLPYEQKLARLREVLGAGKRAAVITTLEGDARKACEYFQEWVGSQQLEGLVLRTEYGTTYKIKPAFSLDAVVVAFGEGRAAGVPELGELAVALMRDDGKLQVVGAVNVGWNKLEQTDLHQRLSTMRVPSTYRLPNHDGMLCRFVRPEIVVEIKCNELMDTDSSDLPLRSMVLRYDAASGYGGVGPMPVSSLVFPVFLRERSDKLVDPGCVGLDQIFHRLPFDLRFQEAAPTARKESQILRRRVWLKTVKSQTAVRKLVALRTNKAGDGHFPAFVVHFTDFSAGRAEPLRTSIRVAPTEEKLEAIVAHWIAENVKRGWSEV